MRARGARPQKRPNQIGDYYNKMLLASNNSNIALAKQVVEPPRSGGSTTKIISTPLGVAINEKCVMCNFENGFILCTCEAKTEPVVHNKKSRRYKNSPQAQIAGYRWFLSRFVDTFAREMEGIYQLPFQEGIYQLPSQDIGAELTAEWVLLNLNCANCFDFDYTPSEGDNLIMRGTDRWEYLSFIFTQGEWRQGHYNHFSTILELRCQGKITPSP